MARPIEANGTISKTDWYQYIRLNRLKLKLGTINEYQRDTHVSFLSWNRYYRHNSVLRSN